MARTKGGPTLTTCCTVHARIGHFGNTSFTFEFATPDGRKQPADTCACAQCRCELIATGDVVAVAVDAKTAQPVRVPEELREAVARFVPRMPFRGKGELVDNQ